jgi:hypothetical protein
MTCFIFLFPVFNKTAFSFFLPFQECVYYGYVGPVTHLVTSRSINCSRLKEAFSLLKAEEEALGEGIRVILFPHL